MSLENIEFTYQMCLTGKRLTLCMMSGALIEQHSVMRTVMVNSSLVPILMDRKETITQISIKSL